MKASSIIIWLLASGAMGATNYVTVPYNEAGAGRGNSSTTFPFIGNPGQTFRHQQVYDADAMRGGGWIQRIAFRPEVVPGGILVGEAHDVQVNMSTTLRNPDGLSSTYAQNVGANDMQVYRGSVSFLGPSHPGGFQGFLTSIEFNQPFFYDPAAGNLLIDIRVYSPWDQFSAVGFDAHQEFGDAASSVRGLLGAAEGPTTTLGLVTWFEMVPIPEPSTIAILTVGFLVFTARLGSRLWRKTDQGSAVAGAMAGGRQSLAPPSEENQC